MKLLEVIRKLSTLDDTFTIYAAKPWSEHSSADLVGGADAQSARSNSNLSYFLEVAIAKELMDDWCKSLKEPPSVEEKCARLIRYAIDDA